jgi:hypothetical protein
VTFRCRIDDIVIVTRDYLFPENEGRLGVIVATASAHRFHNYAGEQWSVQPYRSFWGLSGIGPIEDTHPTAFFDDQLQPMRYLDGMDEVLCIAKRISTAEQISAQRQAMRAHMARKA